MNDARVDGIERLMYRLLQRRDVHALRVVEFRYDEQCRGWPLSEPERNYVGREYGRMVLLENELEGWARVIGDVAPPRRDVLGHVESMPPRWWEPPPRYPAEW